MSATIKSSPIGRILQYGYRGGISTSWKSQNESDANCIAHAYATQILIWETIVGERDAIKWRFFYAKGGIQEQ